jgi:hypothetical protein
VRLGMQPTAENCELLYWFLRVIALNPGDRRVIRATWRAGSAWSTRLTRKGSGHSLARPISDFGPAAALGNARNTAHAFSAGSKGTRLTPSRRQLAIRSRQR